jgi:hypothetical protein
MRDAGSATIGGGSRVRLHSLRNHSLYVAPVRVVLGVLWLALARVAGAAATSAVLAFAGGAFAVAFGLLNDPRRPFQAKNLEPEPVPAEASYAGPVEQALWALLPSTAGVGVLAVAALPWKPVLSALLGGISVGLAVAGVMRALVTDPDLFYDRKKYRLYRR